LFSWLFSLAGGLVVGASALGVLAATGKVAGLSGFTADLIAPVDRPPARRDAAVFLLGMVVAGAVLARRWPARFGVPAAVPHGLRAWPSPHQLALLVLSGLLVGLGARLAGGCTSGHGVCGVGRLSPRSIVATSLFVATGALTVALARLGGAP